MKSYFEFKGYNGSVEFSEEDKVFFGKIQRINDVVTFEAASIIELKEAFQESVLDYLEVLN